MTLHPARGGGGEGGWKGGGGYHGHDSVLILHTPRLVLSQDGSQVHVRDSVTRDEHKVMLDDVPLIDQPQSLPC